MCERIGTSGINNSYASHEGANARGPARGRVLSDGSVWHNVDLSHLEGADRAEAEQAVESQVRKIHELERKAHAAAASGDMALAGHYASEARDAKAALQQIKFELEQEDVDMRLVAALILDGPFAVSPSAPDRVEDCSSDSSSILGDQNGAGSTGGAKGSNIWDGTPDEWVASFHEDPRAFFDELKSLDPSERSAVLMTVQQQIQQDNQLFSMLTNFQQAMHDTQKALISNLRV